MNNYDLRLALELAHTVGRIKAIIEMNEGDHWNMTAERAVTTIREILAEHDAKSEIKP